MNHNKFDIEYCILEDHEIQDVIDFYNSIHHSGRNVEMFKWEFLNGVYGKAIYIIAKDKNTKKIVGSQAAIPIQLINADGQIILSAKSEDTIVDPHYRGNKIFDKMYELLISECKKNNIHYIWGFTHAIKPFKNLGFEIPFSHSQSLLVYDIAKAYQYLAGLDKTNTILKKIKILGLTIISCIKFFLYSNKISQNKDFKTNVLSNFDDISDFDFNKLASIYPSHFSIHRSKKFMDWRVLKNPYAKNNLIISIQKNQKLVAVIVFSSNIDGIWFLMEEFYDNDLSSKEKEEILIRSITILKTNQNNKVHLLRTWDFRHNAFSNKLMNVKTKAGLIHIEKGMPFVWLNTFGNNELDVDSIILSRLSSQGMS